MKKINGSAPPETRWCTNCQQPRPAMDGGWSVFNGGTNRRWRCGACWATHQKRQEQQKEAHNQLMKQANRERAERDRAAKEAAHIKRLERLAGLEKNDDEDEEGMPDGD